MKTLVASLIALTAATAVAAQPRAVVQTQSVVYQQRVVYTQPVTYLGGVEYRAGTQSITAVELEGIVVTPSGTYNASEWKRRQIAKRQAKRNAFRLASLSCPTQGTMIDGGYDVDSRNWLRSVFLF